MISVIIKPENLGPLWPKLLPLVKKMCGKSLGTWTPEKVKEEAKGGFIQLWLAYEPEKPGEPFFAVVGTVIHQTGDALEILFAGGDDMPAWLDQLEEIKAFGRLNGCKYLRFVGRKGWSRVLPDARVIRHLYEMEI